VVDVNQALTSEYYNKFTILLFCDQANGMVTPTLIGINVPISVSQAFVFWVIFFSIAVSQNA
jgi:hypothetical protein